MHSDLYIDVSKFDASKVSEKTAKLNNTLIKILEGGPRWLEQRNTESCAGMEKHLFPNQL